MWYIKHTEPNNGRCHLVNGKHMAGYAGHSMSNNAVAAYEEGMVTLTGITGPWLQSNGVTETAKFVQWLIRENHLAATEWHHTSHYFNRVNFYDGVELWIQLNNFGPQLDALRIEFAQPQEKPAAVQVVAEFFEWEGSRKYGKFVKHSGVAGTVEGNWFVSSEGKRKNVNGNHFTYEVASE